MVAASPSSSSIDGVVATKRKGTKRARSQLLDNSGAEEREEQLQRSKAVAAENQRVRDELQQMEDEQ